MNLILGIDPGSRVSGYGLISAEKNTLTCVTYGAFRFPVKLPLHDRLCLFADNLEEILEKYKPNVMAVESVFTAKNVQSILKLGQIRGVSLMLGARNGLEIAEYSPASVKLAVVGYGRASKSQIQYMVQRTLKLHAIPSPEDAADALAIAICHHNSVRIQKRILRQNDRISLR